MKRTNSVSVTTLVFRVCQFTLFIVSVGFLAEWLGITNVALSAIVDIACWIVLVFSEYLWEKRRV